MKHKGIIFDMDGTLWDSAENVAKSWNKAIADYGYERAPITKEDMYSVMGKTMDVLASIIFPNCTCSSFNNGSYHGTGNSGLCLW